VDEPTIDACPVCGRLHVTSTEGAACESCEPSLPAMPSGGPVGRGALLHLDGGVLRGSAELRPEVSFAAPILSITVPDAFASFIRRVIAASEVTIENLSSRVPRIIMSMLDFARMYEGMKVRPRPRRRARRRPWSGRRR
jgi:hypothetical protein